MEFNKRLAKLYLEFLKVNTNYSNESLEEIKYVFLSILSELEKLILLFMFFMFLKAEKSFVICCIVLISIRINSGGLHFKGFWTCFLFSLSFFFLSIIVLPLIQVSDFIFFAIIVFNIITCVVFAPLQSKNRPKITQKNRLKSKKKSVALILITVFFLTLSHKKNSPLLWAIFLQNIQLLTGGLYEKKQKYNNKNITGNF